MNERFLLLENCKIAKSEVISLFIKIMLSNLIIRIIGTYSKIFFTDSRNKPWSLSQRSKSALIT